jgi:AraC family transcriptional regulator of adaptative response/methylated-DNA-[protein]-cysteine methyltransferase
LSSLVEIKIERGESCLRKQHKLSYWAPDRGYGLLLHDQNCRARNGYQFVVTDLIIEENLHYREVIMQAAIFNEMLNTVEWGEHDEKSVPPTTIFEGDLLNAARPYATDEVRWQAVINREPQADGHFFLGVSTTGIYCRPVCPSRLPNRENVQFFDDSQSAETAGYRPCKRCRPQAVEEVDLSVQAIIQACRIIEKAEQQPSLQQLADEVGLSKYHFHRLFKKVVGVTPKQYAAEKRADRVRNELQKESAVTDAMYNAGYESSSRFYETAASSLGMKPKEYLEGGPGLSIRYAIVQSYLGWVLVAATDQGICNIDFGDTPQGLLEGLRSRFPQANLEVGDPQFEQTVSQVLAFLERPQQGLKVPLDIQGTAFQRRVWSALREIAPGSTASYGDVAASIGKPTAARAVAGACAANKIAVAIPCHRVVRSDGELGGYRWGVARKREILQREAE